MSTIVDCPSCNRKLRVPDELLGKKVKCPTCSGTFDAVASFGSSSSSSSGLGEPQFSLGEKSSAPSSDPVSAAPPGSSGQPEASGTPASEQETLPHFPSKPDDEADLEPCPYCGEKIAKDATRCSFCGEELEDEDKGDRPWDQGYRPYRDVRRDSEPHRGTLILTLGIVSIVTAWLLGPVGLIVGIITWIMGQRDLKKMKANVMDPQGLGSTQAGWICGIIGTAFGGLMSLCCVGYMVMIFGMTASMGRMATPPPPPPTVRPATPAAPAGGPPPMQKQMKKAPAKNKADDKPAKEDDDFE
jgi:predicted Zn finger-like uncharacterized protein